MSELVDFTEDLSIQKSKESFRGIAESYGKALLRDVKENKDGDLVIENEHGNEIKVPIMERESTIEIKNVISNYMSKIDLAEQIWEVQPYFYDKSKIWWLWSKEDFKWDLVDETDVLNMVSDNSTANTIKNKEKAEILESMKQFGRRNIPKKIGDTWIQFQDMIFDIEKNTSFKATPEYFVTNPISYSIGDSMETPVMDRIFNEWVGDEYVELLYQIIAYSLIPSYPINRIFCFIGSGMNGKSKYLELLRNFVGLDNCASTELDTLLTSRFEVTKLHKKLVCQMGETDFNEMMKTSMLKKLSGGDLIGFEYKNKNPFEDINYAKILIATNNLPSTSDKTIGFYRRWLIVDFPNQFTEKKDILSEIPIIEYNNLAKKCISILSSLLKNRKFHMEGTIEERIKKYEDKSNPIQKFIDQYCDLSDLDSFTTKFKFKDSLNQWLKENRHRVMSDSSISKYLGERGIYEGKDNISYEKDGELIKKRVLTWRGISLAIKKSEVSNIVRDSDNDILSLLKENQDNIVSIKDIKMFFKNPEDSIKKLKQDGLIFEPKPNEYQYIK